MTSKINKDIFSQNFHWNAMFGCIKKYMTCGSKIGRLQSQKNITMFEFLSILIEDYHSGASNFILLLSQSQFKAQRLIWIQLFHSNE